MSLRMLSYSRPNPRMDPMRAVMIFFVLNLFCYVAGTGLYQILDAIAGHFAGKV